jgi:hypothetical protein
MQALQPILLLRPVRPMQPLQPIPFLRLAQRVPLRPIQLLRLTQRVPLQPILLLRVARPMPPRPIRLARPTPPLRRPIQGVTTTLSEQYDTAHDLDDHISLVMLTLPNFETIKSDVYY